jgi:hypothetical protein
MNLNPVVNPVPVKPDRRGITTGLKSFLTTGRWPKGCSYVAKVMRAMRRELEELVTRQQAKVPPSAPFLIQSACRHEGRALLLQRKLREQAETLSVDQYVSLLDGISRATTARDGCLKGLGLDKVPGPIDAWDAYYQSAGNGHQGAPAAPGSDIGGPGDPDPIPPPAPRVAEHGPDVGAGAPPPIPP